MKKFYSLLKQIIFCFSLLLIPFFTNAQSFSKATGNWDNTPTALWSTTSGGAASAMVPLSTDAVTIQAGHTITVNAAGTYTCASLVLTGNITFAAGSTLNVTGDISGGGTITMTAGGTLNIGGNNTTSGTFTIGAGTVNYNGGAAQAIRATTYNILGFSGVGQKNLQGATTVSGAFTMAADVSCGANNLILNNTVTYTSGTLSAGANTVTYGGAAQTVIGTTYNNLTLQGTTTKTLQAATIVSGTATIGGTTTAIACAGFNLTFNGPVTYTATGLISSSGAPTVSYNSSSAQDIIPGTYPGTLDLQGLGAKTLKGNTTVTTAFNMASDLSCGNFNLTLNGTVTYTSGTFSIGTNTVTYGFAGAQNLLPLTTYNNLTLSGSGNKTLANATTVNGTAAFAGTAAVVCGTNDLTLNGTVTAVAANTISTGTNTVTYAAAVAQTIVGGIYSNALVLSGAGAKSLISSTTVNGAFSMASALSCGTNALTLAGSVTHTSGTLTTGNNTVTYSGASQTVIGATYSGALTLSGSGTATLDGITVVTGTYNNSVAGLTLATGNNDLTFNGTVTNSGGLTVGTNTVTYGGAAQTVIGTTYNNLTLQGTTTKTLQAATIVSGTATIGGTTTAIACAGFNLTFNGPVTYTATGLISSSGAPTVSYNSSSAQDIIPGTYPGTLDLQGLGAKTLKGNTTVTTAFNMASDLSCGNFNLTLNGTVTYTSGTFSIGTNTVTYGFAGAQNLLPLTTYNNLTLSGSGNKTLANATTVTGTATFAGTAVVVCGTNDLTLNGTVTSAAGNSITTGTNTVTYNGGASLQDIIGGTYSNALSIGGSGAKTLKASTTVNGPFTMAADLSCGAVNITLAGTVTHTSGTLTTGANTVTYSGASQTVIGATYSGNLTLSGSGTKTLDGTTIVSSTFTHNVAGNILDAGNYDFTLSSVVVNVATATITVTNGGTNTVSYSRSAAGQNVLTGTYNNLTLAGAAATAKALSGATIVNSTLTLSGLATISCGVNDLTLNGAVSIATPASNTITTGVNTVTYGATVAQNIIVGTYGGALTFSGASVKTLNGNITVTGNTTINSGADVVVPALTLTSGGNIVINSGGTFELNSTAGTSAILSFTATKSITNAGTLKLLGVNTSFPSSIQNTAGTNTITQSAGTGNFIARFYKFSNLGAAGIVISAGTIDATNNFSDGTFNSGTGGGTYLNLTSFDATGMSDINNVVFNAGPASNVTRTSGTGAVTFATATGALSGEGFDVDNGNPGTLVNWTTPGLTFYSQGTGSFSTLANWNTSAGGGGSNPASGDLTSGLATFIVKDGHTVTVDQDINVLVMQVGQGTSGILTIGNSTTVRNIIVGQMLDVKAGGTVNVGAFTATHLITISANMTNAGTINLKNGAGQVADVTFTGNAAQILGSSTPNFNNLTLSATANVTPSMALNIQGDVTLTTGAILQDGGFTHTVQGNWTQGTPAQITGTGTINFNGALQTINSAITFSNNVSFTGSGTKTFSAAITANGTVTLGGTASIATGANNFTLNGASSYTGSGTISTGANTVSYASGSAQDIFPGTYSNALSISGAGAKTLKGATIVTGTFTHNASLSCGNNDLTLNGTVTYTSGTFTIGTNTVTYGGAAQTLLPLTTYNNLTLQGSAAKTLSGATIVNGTATLAGTATVAAGANNLTFNGSVTALAANTIATGANTVTYSAGATIQDVLGGTYSGNLTFGGSGAKTVKAGTTVTGTLTTASDISCGTNNLTLNGTVTYTSGTLTAGANAVAYNSVAQDIIPGTYGGTLNLAGGAGVAKTLKGSTTVTGTYTHNADLSCGANNLTLNGTVTYTAGTFSVGANTVTYGGAAQNLLPLTTYNNLTLQGSGNKTLANGTTVTGVATFAGTATVVCGANNLTLNGSVNAVAGNSITTGANTVTYSAGATIQDVLGGTYSGNLTFAGSGAKTLKAAVTVTGTLTTASDITCGTSNLTLNGTVTYTSGTLTAGANAVAYNSVAQDIITGTYGGTLTLAGGAGVAKTLKGATTVTGTFTHNADLSTGNNDLTLNGTVTYTAGAFTIGTNTVTYGGAAQTLLPLTTYNNLTLQGSGNKTLANATTVNGIATVAGTAAIVAGVNNLTFNAGVSYTGTGLISTGANAVLYDGTAAQDIIAGTYSGSLTFSGASVKTLKAATTSNGTLTINSGSDVVVPALTLTSGGNIVINSGGTLELNSTAGTSAILSFTATKSITNAGTLKLLGVNTSFPSSIQNTAGTNTITQSAGTGNFIARFYKFSNLGAAGIVISAGTIDATNNFSDGLFNSGTGGGTYLNLIGFDATGMSNINNVIFNAGPTYNVTRTSGTGAVTFINSSGALAGENFDNDNGNPGTLVNWTNPTSTFYSQATGLFSNLTNWNTNPGGGGANPVAGDLTSQLATFIVQNSHTVTIDQDIDVLVLQVGTGASGILTIGNNTTARTVAVRQSLETKAGGTFNVGSFSATHFLNIYANMTNAGTINLMNSATAVADVNFSNTSAQIIGPNTPIYNNFNLAVAANVTANVALNIKGTVTFAAGSILQDGGFTHTVGGNWTQNTAAQLTGTGTIEFNSTGSQTITASTTATNPAATFNNLTFKGGAVANTTGNVVVTGNFLVMNNTAFSTAVNTTIAGSFTVNAGSTYTSTGLTTFNGATAQAIDVSNATFGTLTFSNGAALAKTITGNITTTGLVTINAGATVTGTGSHSIVGLTLNGTCNFSGTVTFLGNNGAITSASNSITIGTAALVFATNISGNNNTWLSVVNAPVALTVNVSNNVTINTGAGLVVQNLTSLAGSGNTLTLNAGANMWVRGSNNFPTGFTTYSLNQTSNVNYDQATNQTVYNAVTYGNMTVSGNTKTAAGALDINGNLNFGSTTSGGVATVSTIFDLGNYSSTIAGNVTAGIAPTLISSGTLTFDNADGNQSLAAGITYTLNSLIFTNTAPTASRTKTIGANITLTGNFTANNTGGSNAIFNIIDIQGNTITGTAGSVFTLGSYTYLYTSGTNTFATTMSSFPSVSLNVSSTVRFNNGTNATDQSIPGGIIYGNIELSGGTNTKTALASLDINGTISRVAGTPVFVDGGFAHTVAGDWLLNSTYYTAPTSTITLDGTTQNVGPLNNTVQFKNIVFAGTTASVIASPLNILGNLTINNGVTVDASTKNINITGNWNNSGTGVFTQTTGTTTFNNATADQTVSNSSTSTFGSLTISKATGFKLTASTDLTMLYDVTFVAGTNAAFDITNRTITVGRHWVFNAGSSLTSTGSTVVFNGAIQQNIRNFGSATFNNMIFSGSGPQIMFDNSFVLTGDLNIAGGLLNNSVSNVVISITLAGNWTNTGSFLPGTGTVTFNGAAETIGTSNFYNIVLSGTNTKTLGGAITVTNNLTIGAGVTLDVTASNYGINVSGNWDNSAAGAIFTPRSGTVTFTGNNATITTGTNTGPAAGKSFYNVVLNKTTGQIATLAGDLDVTNDFTITSGTLTSSTFDISIFGNFSNSDVFNQSNNASALTFTGSGSKNFDPGTSAGNTFRDIIFSASGATYTLQNNLTITNSRTLVINNGTFDLNGKVLSMTGGGAITVITLNGGLLEVDAGAQLLLGNSNSILNQGGTFRVLGTSTTAATIGRNNTTGYTITQTSGVFEARYYVFQNLSYGTTAGTGGSGITISGGTIHSTNNFSDGTFTGGFANSLQFLDLTGFSFGAGITIRNTIFNGTAVASGPAKNVKMTAGTGFVTFLNFSGNLAGYNYENDDNSATSGFLRWTRTGVFWTGTAGDNNWNTPGNWSTGAIPVASDTIYLDHTNVAGVYTVNITSANAVGTRLIIDKGASANAISLVLNNDYTLALAENLNVLTGNALTATTSKDTISVGGNFSIAGTFTPGTASVNFTATSGSNAITLPAGGTFYNVNFKGSGTYTLASAITINNDINITAGTLDVTTGNYAISVLGNWSISGLGVFNPRSGTVTFSKAGTSTQTINGGPFYNFAISNATPATTAVKQFLSNISVNNSVTIGLNTQLNAGTNNLFVGLNWTNNSATNAFVQTGIGIVYFNGTATQTIDNGTFATTFNHISLSGAGQKTWGANSTTNGDFTVSSGSGTVELLTYTITGAGSNTLTIAGATQMNVRGANNFPQSYETISLASNSTVYYAGNLDQTIYATTYGNLSMNSNGGATNRSKTAAGDLTVVGSLNNNADIYTQLDMATNNANINVGVNYNLITGGRQIAWGSTGTFTYSYAAGNLNIDADITGFNNLVIAGANTKIMNSNLALTGNLNVQNGTTLAMGVYTLTGTGTKTITLASGSALTSGIPSVTGVAFPTGFGTYTLDPASTVTINGAANQTVACNLTYGNLTITTNPGTSTLNGNLIVAGNLVTGNNPIFADGGFNITVAGNCDLRNYTPTSTSILTLNGTAQTLYDATSTGGNFPLDIANIVFAGSGTKTIGNGYNNTVNISGNLTVNSGVTVTSNRPINYSGATWVNNGTWTNTGLLTYNGAAAQSVDPGAVNTFSAVTIANTSAPVTYTGHGANFTGAFIVNAGDTANMGTTNLTHVYSSTITNNGTWLTSKVNLTLSGGAQVIPGNDQTTPGVLTAKDIITSNAGTKTMSGNWTIRNLTIGVGTTLTTTASNYSITLTRSWTNNGTFTVNNSTVTFNGTTSPQTITSGGSNFYDVVFSPGASVSYTLLSPSTRFARSMNIGSNATLNVNSETLILGSNIAAGKVFTVAGTLNINANAVVQFNNQTSQSVMTVTGTLYVVGTSGNVASITREVAGVVGSETSIQVTTGTIHAQYYLIEYLADAGMNLATSATVDNTDNFSNGTWSNLNTAGGPGKKYYLVYDAPATASTVTNVTFNFVGTPTAGVHYNVKRSIGTTGTLAFIDPINGTLGTFTYEDDQGGPASATLGGITWPVTIALTWTGATNRDWNVATNWTPNTTPTASADVTIPLVVNNPLVTSANAVCKSLTITNGSLGMQNAYSLTASSFVVIGTGASAGVISVADPACVINVGGAWTRGANGTFSHGNGTVNFNGIPGSYTIAPLTSAFYNITFSGASTTYNLSGTTLNVAGSFTINNSTVTPSTNPYTLNLSGNYTNNSGTFTGTAPGTVVLNGAAQTITGGTFNNLTVSGTGIKTTSGATTIAGVLNVNSTLAAGAGSTIAMNGNVTINAGGTFDDGGNSHTFAGATWTGTGSYAGAGTVTFNRATGQTINGASFNNLVLSCTNGNVTLGGNVGIVGDLTVSMGTANNSLLTSTYLITNTSGTGTMTVNPNLQVQIAGVNNCPIGFGNYNFDPASTTVYTAAFDQTVGGIEYGNLNLNNATTKTLGGNVIVDGTLTFNTATLDVSTSNYSVTVAGGWSNNSGSFIARAGDVILNGAAGQAISINGAGTKTFNNLTVNKSAGTVTINAANNVLGDLTVLSGTYDNNGNTTTVGGSLRAISGAFSNSATYILTSSSGSENIQTNGSTLGNLTINAPGTTFLLQDNLTMNGNFTLTAGTFDGNAKSVSIGNAARTIDISGTYKVGAGGTLALFANSSLTVSSTGIIEVVGSTTSNAVVTHNTGRYTFVVNGIIKAQYYLFEFMNNLGIQINSSATIDATDNFSNGTFTNGAAGGPYLRIENTQTIALISNVSFPVNPGGGSYNVMKTSAVTGSLTFDNASGTFAGSSFENDPGNLINWTGPITLTWVGTTSTDWYTATNWTASSGPSIVPTGAENVIIAFHTNQPIINIDGALTKNLTINTSASITVSTPSSLNDLTVQGDLLINGSLVLSTTNDVISVAGNYTKNASGTVNLNGTVNFTASSGTKVISNGTGTFYNIVVNATGTYQLGANTTVNNNLTITSGILDVTGSNYSLTVKGNWVNNGTFTPQGGTVTFNQTAASTYTINNGTSAFFNLAISGGASTIYQLSINALNVNGNATVSAGTLNLNGLVFNMGDGAGADILTIAGIVNVNAGASLKMGANSSVAVNSGGIIKVVGNATAYAAVTRQSAGSYSFAVNSGGTIYAQYYLFEFMGISGIQVKLGATIDATNNFSYGTFSNGFAGGRYLQLANAFSDFTADSVVFNSGPTYNVSRIGVAGVITFHDASGVKSNYFYEDDDNSATTGLILWTYTNPQLFWTGTTSTDWNDATNWQDISLANIIPDNTYSVVIPDVSAGSNRYPVLSTGANGATKDLTLLTNTTLTISSNKNLTVSGSLLINGAATFTVSGGSASTITVGNLFGNSGTFTPGASTVILTATSGSKSITNSSGSFNNLTINGGATFQTSGSYTITGNMLISAGTFQVTSNAHILTVGGNWTNSGTFIHGNGSVIFNKTTGTQTISGTGNNFKDVTFSTTGSNIKTVSLGGNITINGNLTISGSNCTFAAGANTVDVKGNWTNGGKVLSSTGTVIFSGTTQQTIFRTAGETFKNLTINNTCATSPQVTLGKRVDVTGILTLTAGTLYTGTGSGFLFMDFSTAAIDKTGAGAISGKLTVTRTITPAGYHYFSSPLQGTTYADISDDTPYNSYNFFVFNQSLPNYVSVSGASGTSLTTQKYTGGPANNLVGYALNFYAATTVFDMTGTYSHGTSYSSGTLSYNSSAPIASRGYHLIGNPYPSYINWNSASITKTNLNAGITFYNCAVGQNADYTPDLGLGEAYTNGASPYIPPMQAFWIQTNNTGAALNIGNNARTITPLIGAPYNAPSYYRKASASIPVVKLALENSIYSDETVIRFGDLASENFDGSFDVYKQKNDAPCPSFYTESVEGQLSINSLPTVTPDREVPLIIDAPGTGSYTIKVREISNFDGMDVLLEDKVLNTIYDLKDSVYTFSMNKGDAQSRFVLKFRTSLITKIDDAKDVKDLNVNMYSLGNEIKINLTNNNSKTANISVFDLVGREVYKINNADVSNGNYSFELPNNPASAVYVIKVITDGHLYSDKLLLQPLK